MLEKTVFSLIQIVNMVTNKGKQIVQWLQFISLELRCEGLLIPNV